MSWAVAMVPRSGQSRAMESSGPSRKCGIEGCWHRLG